MTNPEPVPQKKRGCFFYGCLTCVILFLVVALGLFLAGRYALNFGRRVVADYTDTAPMTLPKSDLPADEIKKLQARVDAFSAGMDAHSNMPPLVLTSPEINALINNSPSAKDYKGKFYVALDGDEIKGQVSLPLDGIPQLKMLDANGRYLNGSGTFKAAITNGKLSVSVNSLEVKGKPLPANFMAGLQQQNLADKVNNGPNGPQFDKFESVQVKDSTLIVTPKPN